MDIQPDWQNLMNYITLYVNATSHVTVNELHNVVESKGCQKDLTFPIHLFLRIHESIIYSLKQPVRIVENTNSEITV